HWKEVQVRRMWFLGSCNGNQTPSKPNVKVVMGVDNAVWKADRNGCAPSSVPTRVKQRHHGPRRISYARFSRKKNHRNSLQPMLFWKSQISALIARCAPWNVQRRFKSQN